MRVRSTILGWPWLLWLALPQAVIAASDPAGTDATQAISRAIRPFLEQHCVECHGPQKQKGKLRLDTLTADFRNREAARVWIEVMDRLNLGEMPPEEKPRPAVEQAQAVTHWIAEGLRQAERQASGNGGRVLLRRLNRTEYANTLRDLLGLTFLPGESPLDFLPPDGRLEGFDKTSAALMIDPSLLDKYYEVATRVAQAAIVTGPPEFPTLTRRFEYEKTVNNTAIRYQTFRPSWVTREHDVVVMEAGARTFGELLYGKTRKMIPVKGFYRVRVRAAAEPGARREPVRLNLVRNGGASLLKTIVDAPPESPRVYETIAAMDSEGGNEIEAMLVGGTRFSLYSPASGELERAIEDAGRKKDFATVQRLAGRKLAEGLITGSRPNPEAIDTTGLPKLYLDWIEIEGPLYEQWPPRSHEILLLDGPDAPRDLGSARETFEHLLPRAFRRPTTPEEAAPIVRLVAQELAQGQTFEDAVRTGLTAVLTSPKFLYLWEPGGSEPRSLADHELAVRLAYFLWSSMPDDELFRLAAAGRLHEPESLAAQVDRMLGDGKSRAFIDGFGAQWLRTDQFRTFLPDPKIYKSYDDDLGKAMVGQTLAFFEEIFRHDLSVLNLIDSDWTMLNGPLAALYGIEGVEGESFRRVSLPPGSPRGGLLGQAGVALYGSDGTRTKPVRRGVYVREVLFNDPPDPPPPNVGEIEPNIKGKNLSVRERLLAHQQIESCAACHRGIDAYGLALENFNVIGAWRDRQDGEEFRGAKTPPIDASGRLPNGKSFTQLAEFKALLMEQRDRFSRAVVEKLFVYALGRPVEPSDRGTIDALAQQMADHGYTLRGAIKGLVLTPQFQTK